MNSLKDLEKLIEEYMIAAENLTPINHKFFCNKWFHISSLIEKYELDSNSQLIISADFFSGDSNVSYLRNYAVFSTSKGLRYFALTADLSYLRFDFSEGKVDISKSSVDEIVGDTIDVVPFETSQVTEVFLSVISKLGHYKGVGESGSSSVN